MKSLLLLLCSFVVLGKSQNNYTNYEYPIKYVGQVKRIEPATTGSLYGNYPVRVNENTAYSNPLLQNAKPNTGNINLESNPRVETPSIYKNNESFPTQGYPIPNMKLKEDVQSNWRYTSFQSSSKDIQQENRNTAQLNYNYQNPDRIVFQDNYYTNSNNYENANVQPAVITPPKQYARPLVAKLPNNIPSSNMDIRAYHSTLGLTNFGINLLKNIKNSKNTVLSPFSIASVLLLLEQGANEETEKEIASVIETDVSYGAGVYKFFVDDIKERDPASPNILKTANNLFVSNSFALNSEFKHVARDTFNSDVTPINFGNTRNAAETINSWVSDKTNHKIEKLLDPDMISQNSALILCNALYFKGVWRSKFHASKTTIEEFLLADGTKKRVPFMHAHRYYRMSIDATGTQILSIPFHNEQYSMMLILPSETSNIDAVLKNLNANSLMSIRAASPKEVDLDLPKFTVKDNIDLDPILKSMGLKNIFSKQSGLTGVGDNPNNPITVTSAIHAATLSIDEEGSVGAASSGLGSVTLSLEPIYSFKADRPFLAIVWDTYLSIPLFMCRIEDPSQ